MPRRFSFLSVAQRLYWLLLAILVAAAGYMGFVLAQLPRANASTTDDRTAYTWSSAQRPASEDWGVFRSSSGHTRTTAGPLAERYRLAGTFFSQIGSGEEVRRAIVDDVKANDQLMVQEGDRVNDMEIREILKDRIIVASRGREEELLLSFIGAVQEKRGGSKKVDSTINMPERVLEENRFGKRVGENRWVLSRDAVVSYYNELLDDPERLALIYLSLKPDYNEKRAIQGYHLGVEGEGEFFKAMGLQEGDKVRKVNSMPMVSQTRAEYFLGEFQQDKLSAVVLDIERGDEAKKLVYLIR